MTREATRSWVSFLLAIVLVSHCITSISCQATNISAVANGDTILQESYGLSSSVLTEVKKGVAFHIYCRVLDEYIFDDPWWLKVNIDGVGDGWVADYYADCGYVGNCQADICL